MYENNAPSKDTKTKSEQNSQNSAHTLQFHTCYMYENHESSNDTITTSKQPRKQTSRCHLKPKVSKMRQTFANLVKKRRQNRWYIQKVKIWNKTQNVRTFENLKTDPLFRLVEMKVTCRKCDRGARNLSTDLCDTPRGYLFLFRHDPFSASTV